MAASSYPCFFYETIIDKADSGNCSKTPPKKLVACGVVSIIWVLYYGLNQKPGFWIVRFLNFFALSASA
jgi:hypothetical protein